MKYLLVSVVMLVLAATAAAQQFHDEPIPYTERTDKEDETTFGSGGNPTTIQLLRHDDGVDVVIRNTLTLWMGGDVHMSFDLDGWEVRVVYYNKPGGLSDTAVVHAPPGWVATPTEITIKEGTTVVIRLTPIIMG